MAEGVGRSVVAGYEKSFYDNFFDYKIVSLPLSFSLFLLLFLSSSFSLSLLVSPRPLPLT